ncbi:MAG TPA: hypothetical protein VGQ33_22615, partial [Vicinamibacteria bacterium]|nr:hypothetical protein [Vicinamibacteria bacterium]
MSARRPPARAALAVLAAGAGLGVLGMATGVSALVPAAIAPLAIGMSLLIVGERGFRARFTPTGMEIAHPRQTIAYSTLLEVRPLVPADRPRPDSFPIQVTHTRGALVIPARLTLSSERVYSFLRGFLADRRPTLPSALEAYRVEQEGSFGPQKVWCYAGRTGGDRSPARTLRAVGAGLLVAAAVWTAIPFRRTDEPGWWVAAGAAAAVGVALLVQDAHRQRRETSGQAAAHTTAALVIAPLGLAVQQGELTGHLTWQEIRKVSVRSGRATMALSSAQTLPGIVLEVEGASIVLTDSYDRPLSEIHDR